MTSAMAKATRSTKMGMSMKAISRMAKHTERGCLRGVLARLMMGSGRKDSKMGMVFGEVPRESTILASGRIAGLMVRACMFGATGISMRVTGKTDLSMAKEVIFLGNFNPELAYLV